MNTATYRCGHCAYEGPCYGIASSQGVSAPVCRQCEMNDKLTLLPQPAPIPERRVVCAAMTMLDGTLILGVRHFSPDMRETMKRIYGEGYHLRVVQQGFVDQWGKFLTREEAWDVAKAAGQILREVSTPGTLYSESLY